MRNGVDDPNIGRVGFRKPSERAWGVDAVDVVDQNDHPSLLVIGKPEKRTKLSAKSFREQKRVLWKGNKLKAYLRSSATLLDGWGPSGLNSLLKKETNRKRMSLWLFDLGEHPTKWKRKRSWVFECILSAIQVDNKVDFPEPESPTKTIGRSPIQHEKRLLVILEQKGKKDAPDLFLRRIYQESWRVSFPQHRKIWIVLVAWESQHGHKFQEMRSPQPDPWTNFGQGIFWWPNISNWRLSPEIVGGLENQDL